MFNDEPFEPLTVRVQDRTGSAQVGAFLPGQMMIRLADTPRPAARSGNICMHEFTPQRVQITVRILGGMMDDDRVTSVRDDQLIVKDHGRIRVIDGWRQAMLTT